MFKLATSTSTSMLHVPYKRSSLMPDVPTLKAQGINDVDVSQW